uniref:Uncharacterized protein n=1 Tax=Romanomermis culicivorax TaxID=13658 RepID=A0A915JG92_ROMCU
MSIGDAKGIMVWKAAALNENDVNDNKINRAFNFFVPEKNYLVMLLSGPRSTPPTMRSMGHLKYRFENPAQPLVKIFGILGGAKGSKPNNSIDFGVFK